MRWANLPGHGHTIAEACSRFGVTASAYRRARKAFGASVPFAGDEIVLAGLSGGNVVTVESLIFYVDWIDHAALSRGEMIAILDRLIVTGLVRKRDGVEKYTTEVIAENMQMLGGREGMGGGDEGGSRSYGGGEGAARPTQRPAAGKPAAPTKPPASGFDDMDDDIPF